LTITVNRPRPAEIGVEAVVSVGTMSAIDPIIKKMMMDLRRGCCA
jgi:hypothetical protein